MALIIAIFAAVLLMASFAKIEFSDLSKRERKNWFVLADIALALFFLAALLTTVK